MPSRNGILIHILRLQIFEDSYRDEIWSMSTRIGNFIFFNKTGNCCDKFSGANDLEMTGTLKWLLLDVSLLLYLKGSWFEKESHRLTTSVFIS